MCRAYGAAHPEMQEDHHDDTNRTVIGAVLHPATADHSVTVRPGGTVFPMIVEPPPNVHIHRI
ncbi:hypothetical protein GCM10027416_23100 [Okibacterium endophyticum]